MKGWLLLISVTLGLIGAAAGWFWSRVDWQAAQLLQAEAPAVPGDTAMPSPGVRPTAEPGS